MVDGQYVGSWEPGSAEHPFRRYTLRFEHFPRVSRPVPYQETTLRVSTAGGEHKAAVFGAMALQARMGDIVISTVELIGVEDRYELDPAHDIVDHHELG